MKLSVVTAMCGRPEITCRFLEETAARCTTDPELVIVNNGSADEEMEQVALRALALGLAPQAHTLAKAPQTEGSIRAFNFGARCATGDVLAMLHNDVLVREEGWDRRLLEFVSGQARAGIVGFHGAQGLGALDIYRTPYRLEQLARWNCWSNLEDWEAHGNHAEAALPVAVVDGLAICCWRADLLAWGGLDEGLGPHHMYDNDICLTALAAGRTNYVLPILARHLSGQTANYPRHNEAFVHLGGDAGIHRTAHARFYEKWRGRLPVYVGQSAEETAWWRMQGR